MTSLRSSASPARALRAGAVTATAAALVLGSLAPGAAAAPPRPADPAAPRPEVAAGSARAAAARAGKVRVAVTTRPGADAGAVVAAARGHGAELHTELPQLHAFSIEVPAQAYEQVTAALARRPDVSRVSLVATRTPGLVPDDTKYAAEQAAYFDEIDAPEAFDVTHGSSAVTIAVIDSGVDLSHPDLAGKIAGAYSAATNNSTVTDTNGHGTFVAGVAAAATNNGAGIAGAGYDSRLLAVKVADGSGGITTDLEAEGIVWAADNGADVINISLGGPADPLEADAVAYARTKGALVVASAGNDNTATKSYPGALPGVLAVGATTGGSRASFSNYGSWVDVGAPGVDIHSTTPLDGSTIWSTTSGYAGGNGTSFSAPLVAGQAALLRALHPAASADTIAATIGMTADTTNYGFVRGRVNFRNSVSAPTLTAPAAGEVGGHVTVTAESTAPSVRFAIDGGPEVTVPVVGGVATTTLETYGLSGARTVTATDCYANGCGLGTDTVTVTVANGAPTITGPAPDTSVEEASFQATATTPDSAGGVRFYVDDTSAGFDGSAPYEATIGASALADGAHLLTAARCNAAGTVCDAANPSAAVPFTVGALHPALTTISPGRFSPNADGRLDTTTVTYTVDVPQQVSVSVVNSSGGTVRGPIDLGEKTAGTHTWVWDGKSTGGTVVPDGTYRVELVTSAPDGKTGAASRTVVVDRTAPVMSGVSAPTAFYPVRDGYKDTMTASVNLNEGASLSLKVYNSAGTRIRTVTGGSFAAGKASIVWDGKTASGSIAPAGTYKYEFVATDAASNTRTTSRYSVTVSAKKLVLKYAEKTVTPLASDFFDFTGRCSAVTAGPSTWTNSVRYLSNRWCTGTDEESYVETDHQLVLPSAIKYGNVRVGVTGRAYTGRGVSGSQARLTYLDKNQDLTSYADTALGSAYGLRWGPSASSSTLLDGRTVRWFTWTAFGHHYEIRSYTVKWGYYVLA